MSDVSGTTSGLTGAGGGNMIRLTGMNSGLDVDAVVKKMMAAEQVKIDKAKQEQQVIQWRQEAYQDIIKDIRDLQSSFFNTSDSSTNILSSSNYAGFDVNGGDSTVANVTAGTGAQVGTYVVDVTSIATGAGISNTLSGKNLSTKLTDIDTTSNTDFTGSIVLKLKVNGATSDTTISLDNSAGDKTIGDLVNAINNQSSGAVKASFSELTGKFSLTTSATGDAASLTIDTGTTSDLSKVIGFNVADDGAGKTSAPWNVTNSTSDNVINGATAIKSANAVLKINGTEVTGKSTNNFTIDGISYSLVGSGTSTVTVGSNPDKVYDKFKGFIDKYNAIIDKIQTKLTEKKALTYKPLTDTQKASMKDSEIASWETKAKQGILKNDTNLQNLMNDLRSVFTTPVNGLSISMTKYGSDSIGLDYSSDYKNPGRIEIADSSKFKQAIITKGDQLLQFFTNVSTNTTIDNTDGKTVGYHESGVFARVKNIIQDNVGYANVNLNNAILTKYANFQDDTSKFGGFGKNTLPDQIYQKQLLIEELNKSFATKQENYYQKFSKLETALNKLSSQQSALSQMGS